MTPELRAAITGYLDEGWAVVSPRQGGRGGRARNPYPRSGPARGLLRRIQTREFRNAGRDLVGPVSGLTGAAGTCVWCGQEAEGRRRWHDPCARAYRIARGRQDVPVAPPEWCARAAGPISGSRACAPSWTTSSRSPARTRFGRAAARTGGRPGPPRISASSADRATSPRRRPTTCSSPACATGPRHGSLGRAGSTGPADRRSGGAGRVGRAGEPQRRGTGPTACQPCDALGGMKTCSRTKSACRSAGACRRRL